MNKHCALCLSVAVCSFCLVQLIPSAIIQKWAHLFPCIFSVLVLFVWVCCPVQIKHTKEPMAFQALQLRHFKHRIDYHNLAFGFGWYCFIAWTRHICWNRKAYSGLEMHTIDHSEKRRKKIWNRGINNAQKTFTNRNRSELIEHFCRSRRERCFFSFFLVSLASVWFCFQAYSSRSIGAIP